MTVVFPVASDDGQEFLVSAITVVGRTPSLRNLPLEDDEIAGHQLVTVPDPERSVSRTHLILGIYADELWVEDAGSGNGTDLHYPDGSVYPCPPGERFVVDPGCTLSFGDRTLSIGDPHPMP